MQTFHSGSREKSTSHIEVNISSKCLPRLLFIIHDIAQLKHADADILLIEGYRKYIDIYSPCYKYTNLDKTNTINCSLETPLKLQLIIRTFMILASDCIVSV